MVRLAVPLDGALVSPPQSAEAHAARFTLAPPRHFLLPAVLLLIAESPSHGYQLVKELSSLRFGPVDRPSVYRALAQLEADSLVEAWSDAPVAGSMRRVYGLTRDGGRVLRAWMGVVKEEREVLDRVLRRYAATGTVDALLAEAESGLAAVGSPAWSAVSATSETDRRPRLVDPRPKERDDAYSADQDGQDGEPADGRRRYRVVPDRSALLIEARSTVGPINFGALGLTGSVEVDVAGGAVVADNRPTARLEIPVSELRSGNRLYDAELLRRIDARRFPLVTLELGECTALGFADRFRLGGSATLHGVTRPTEGTVVVSLPDDRSLAVSGEQGFDIRDFGIELPTILMLRIYPDVTVRLQIEAVWDGGNEEESE